MNNEVKMANELKARFENINEELRAAKTHFHIFNALRDPGTQLKKDLDRAPLFWSFTRQAHLQAAVISLCRIFDHHRDGIHFLGLLEAIRQNAQLFDRQNFQKREKDSFFTLASNARIPTAKEIDRDIEFCGIRSPLVATLRKWRNNAIAHTSHRIILGQRMLPETDALTYEAIGKLIDGGYRILNLYSGLFQGETFDAFPEEQLNDFRQVFRHPKAPGPVHDASSCQR
jgi:hypothetical protein